MLTTSKVTPLLQQECDKFLPKLIAGDTATLLLWKTEADTTYRECKDKMEALIKATE